MQYDFNSIIDRRGKDATAVDSLGLEPGFAPEKPKEGFDAIPMWIADMNFATVPSVTEAIAERIKHPAFGYFRPSEEYYQSIIRWQEERNGVCGLKQEHIGYENGVLGGVVSVISALTSEGDAVLLHGPTYVGFTNSIGNIGRKIVTSMLQLDDDGIWRMDFDDMETKLKDNKIHVAVFCSPHNPCGRVWERWEMERAMKLYQKYDCVVISDEIWSDILLNGHKHITTQSISEDARMRTVAMYAPSKTFNLAGLVASYHIVYHSWLRDRIRSQAGKCHYNGMNVLSMHALIGAYGDAGQVWVDELREVLSANINYACDYIRLHFDGVTAAKPEGTYMLFLDCTKWCKRSGLDMDQLLRAGWEVGVAWQDGRPFHGEYAIRMNLALPLSRIKEAFERLDRYVFGNTGDCHE